MQSLQNNTTGNSNTALGYRSLTSNTDGYHGTAVGFQALLNNTTGYDNTAIGYQSLQYNTTGGQYNTAVGSLSLENNTTGQYNTCIGYNSGNGLINYNNTTCVGHAANKAESNAIVLGNGNIANLYCNQTTITTLSDRRDKTEIEDLPLGLDFINKIKPVKFKWNRREEYILNGTFEAGFIAQDLLVTQEDFDSSWLNLVNTNDPEKYMATPHKMFPIMLKSIQELSAANKVLEDRIKMLEDK